MDKAKDYINSDKKGSGGLVVSVLALHSDDLGLNLLKPTVFSINCCLNRSKINKYRLGLSRQKIEKEKKIRP